MDPLLAVILVTTGAYAGLASGLFGVGGGIVMVPVLHYVARAGWADSVAASLLVIALTSPTGLVQQHARGNVWWREGLALGLAGVAGVFLAAGLQPLLPVAALKAAFAALLLLTAWRLGRHPAREGRGPAGLEPARTKPRFGLLLAAGVAAGFVAKLLGIGGGILMVPGMMALAVPIHAAVATSLLPVFTNAALSTGVNLAGATDWLAPAWWLLGGALPGIVLGVAVANRTRPRPLQVAFAVVLALVALYVLADAAGAR